MPIFEVAIPCEVFGRPRQGLLEAWYEFRVCAAQPGQTQIGSGFVVGTEHGFDALDWAETIIVPAIANIDIEPPPTLIDALQRAHDRGARIASICSGAFALAAAGLLDGRRATLHWMHVTTLAKRYPKVRLEPAVLYVEDGNVLTSAGSAAGLDLCLHIVRGDCGAEIANLLARRLVIPAHRPGGQAQYVETPLPRHDSDSIAPVLQWALEHLDRPLTTAELAKRHCVTPRTLIRHFQAATGSAPLRWLLAQRVQRARWLLESTDESTARIADRCGLGTEANLRHHFARLVGLAPTEYRRTFRASATR
jgi:transcriptional regulator GlxA family with amidase domain